MLKTQYLKVTLGFDVCLNWAFQISLNFSGSFLNTFEKFYNLVQVTSLPSYLPMIRFTRTYIVCNKIILELSGNYLTFAAVIDN